MKLVKYIELEESDIQDILKLYAAKKLKEHGEVYDVILVVDSDGSDHVHANISFVDEELTQGEE